MLRSKLSSLREYLTPINHSSSFTETGEISPEEFVKAGDYLVYKFPTWEWGSCPKNLQKSFLPADRQFLVTRHVPSYRRASRYLGTSEGIDEEEEELEDGWIKSHRLEKFNEPTDTGTVDDQIGDIDELIDEDAEENDTDGDEEFEDDNDLEMINNGENNLRRYDLYITYSTSYRVPKMYLIGFNSNGIPLLPDKMFEDIESDYKDKTATIENLPVSHNATAVSIHPCKHSSVMKVLMQHSKRRQASPEVKDHLSKLSLSDNNTESSTKTDTDPDYAREEGIRVDQYLVVFLKFIASVTPGIEYDYTMDAL